jgi:GTPase SAR1 family protein
MEVVVVGPCGSGKSTLVRRLIAHGYDARVVAQEHSAAPELWRHAGDPAALIVLEAELDTINRRRGGDFPPWLLARQHERLASARAHATLVLQTDHVTPEEVAAKVIATLHRAGIRPGLVRGA